MAGCVRLVVCPNKLPAASKSGSRRGFSKGKHAHKGMLKRYLNITCGKSMRHFISYEEEADVLNLRKLFL